jgi:hypothetical protein
VEFAGAMLIGLTLAVAMSIPYVMGYPPPVHWPVPPENSTPGGWSGVSRLASALNRADADTGVFERMIEPRLDDLITDRARSVGLSPADERIVALRRQLAQAGQGSRTATTIESVLDRLDELTTPEGPT